tara:strand:- start:683 stop:1144 length:462 start_codon:yes stop_codon:yes gene_type:complete
MKKIIYSCLLAMLALSFGCEKEDISLDYQNTELTSTNSVESGVELKSRTSNQTQKTNSTANRSSSSNVILIRFSPNTSPSEIQDVTESVAPTSAIQCPNGDFIWVLTLPIGPDGRTINQNGDGDDDDDIDINSIPSIIAFQLNGVCSGGGSQF